MQKHPSKQFLLSIISDEISQDPDIAIELAVSHHYDGIELRSVWDTPVERLPLEKQKKLAMMLQESMLSVSAIASSFLKDDWMKDDDEKFQLLIQTCHIFNCNKLRAFSFWASEKYSDEEFAIYLERYNTILKKEGIDLVLENDPAVNLCSAKELGRFFSKYEFSNIGILWDPGNDIYTHVGKTVPYPDGYRLVYPYIKHVHLKDAIIVNGQPIGTAFGDGLLNCEGQLKALKESGYCGWITLEPHYRLDSEISEELLKRPGGAAFSENGYLPSKICMERLDEILARI